MASGPFPVLLAPVPLLHPLDGINVCAAEGEVAFGTRAWEVFSELDTVRQDQPVKTYIYASHKSVELGVAVAEGAKVGWVGRYVRQVTALNDGSHPDGRRFRPPSTWDEDGRRYWLAFWQVVDLRQLPPEEHIWTHDFRDRKDGKKAPAPYAPEGPMLKLYP